MDLHKYINLLGATIATIAYYLWGGWDVWTTALVAMIVIDYLTGIIAGFINQELSSRKGLSGIAKKLLYFLAVAVGCIVDDIANSGGILRAAVIGYIVANEGLSALENCGRAGAKFIPPKLMAALEQLKGDDEKGKSKKK